MKKFLISILFLSVACNQAAPNQGIAEIFGLEEYSRLKLPLIYAISANVYLASDATGTKNTKGLYMVNTANSSKEKIDVVYDVEAEKNINGNHYFLLNASNCKRGVCSSLYKLIVISKNAKIYGKEIVTLIYDGLGGRCGREFLGLHQSVDDFDWNFGESNQFRYQYQVHDCTNNNAEFIERHVPLNISEISKWEKIYDK